MSNKALFSLAFIIGAATGSVVTWYLLKDKYEALAQEEIDSVKEVFLRREQELKDQSVKKTVAEGIKDTDKEKPDLKEYARRLEKEGYTRYSDFGSDEEEKPVSEAGPYVIPPEQFGDNEEHEQISLTYYADGVLADENDEVIEDVEDAVGIDSLNHFGEYEDDSVFVRNDARKCDYEILLDQRTYSEVVEDMLTRDELNNAYFDWMYQLVCDDEYSRGLSYRKLLSLLHDTDFTYTIALDGNRYDDGIDLRYRFGNEQGYRDSMIASYLDNRPCSVLEMIIALAIRLEEHIMDDPDIGNRTGQWFWDMIVSLGLGSMDDSKFDKAYAIDVIRRFLNRDYERDGKGGLFTIEHCRYDMRDIEIWYQANWYLDNIR